MTISLQRSDTPLSSSRYLQEVQQATANTSGLSLDRAEQHRQTILLSLREDSSTDLTQLSSLSLKEWRKTLHWLDVNGLALYFVDRLTELGQGEILPFEVLLRLKQNLADNTARIDSMIAESSAIHHAFQAAGLSYATLKGFSLWPVSVPKLELRSQLDLDFLIAEVHAPEARRLLELRGYRLHAISGRSWEFKADGSAVRSLKDHYKAVAKPSVELHLEPANAGHNSLLSRTEKLCLHGVCMPVLPPVDLLLGQGMHLYKHICGEHFRNAHLLEFRRHILARYDNCAFWSALRDRAERDPIAPFGLGVAIYLISTAVGQFAPRSLTSWTVDRLPIAARLWVELYGRRTVLSGSLGSKSYLLLQREVEKIGAPAKRSRLQALVPRGLPPSIEHKAPGETPFEQLGRYYRQLRFVFLRLRFHMTEGLRYLRESILWERRLRRYEAMKHSFNMLASDPAHTACQIYSHAQQDQE